jgi:hypothetical protein
MILRIIFVIVFILGIGGVENQLRNIHEDLVRLEQRR